MEDLAAIMGPEDVAMFLQLATQTHAHLPYQVHPRNEIQILDQRLPYYGFDFTPVRGDGNCVMRAFAHQLFNDVELHERVRNVAVAQLISFVERISQVGESVPEAVTQAVVDAFEVKVTELTHLNRRCIQEFIPRSGRYKKEIYFCSSQHHTDVMFRV